MYIIRVALKVQKEDIRVFENNAREESREVPRRFPGCRAYGFHAALGRPGSYLLYEEWESAEAFARYRQSEYFEEVGTRLRPMLSESPDSAYFDATAVALR